MEILKDKMNIFIKHTKINLNLQHQRKTTKKKRDRFECTEKKLNYRSARACRATNAREKFVSYRCVIAAFFLHLHIFHLVKQETTAVLGTLKQCARSPIDHSHVVLTLKSLIA